MRINIRQYQGDTKYILIVVNIISYGTIKWEILVYIVIDDHTVTHTMTWHLVDGVVSTTYRKELINH